MNETLLDASSAILLYKTGLLEDLIGVYQVFVARSVQEELICENRPGGDIFARYMASNAIGIIDTKKEAIDFQAVPDEMKSLGLGELDTINCFKAGKGEFIITDDGRAARYCRDNGVPFINALLFPRLLYLAGFISLNESRKKMDTVIRIGRYSPQIKALAFDITAEKLAFAIPGRGVH